ncbi:MAG: nucleotide-binding protein [Rhizobiaceae bacterium]
MDNRISNILILIDRLKDLEAEFLDLSATNLPAARQPTLKLYEQRLEQLEQSHSRSWLGNHSTTYFEKFQTPPSGGSFDVEWGLLSGFNGSHNPRWRIYTRSEICEFLFEEAGEEIYDELHALARELKEGFAIACDQAIDVLDILLSYENLAPLTRYKSKLEQDLKPYELADYINERLGASPRVSRDSEAVMKGSSVPTHVQHLAAINSLKQNKSHAKKATGILRNIIEFVKLQENTYMPTDTANKIFIGHGRSELWRVLKDFVSDRLKLDYEEFNRFPTPGMGTQERISEMLNGCGFAFVILTGEDVHGDETLHARENVVHEAGLFQGRLGWRKAIILLEDDCQEFSNIVGLGQIRFPKGDIEACFEKVRGVLEREGLLNS